MEEVPNNDRLLSRPEVQKHFGISQRFLEVAAVRGDGPPVVKIGRSVRYQVRDIRAWINACREVIGKDGGHGYD